MYSEHRKLEQAARELRELTVASTSLGEESSEFDEQILAVTNNLRESFQAAAQKCQCQAHLGAMLIDFLKEVAEDRTPSSVADLAKRNTLPLGKAQRLALLEYAASVLERISNPAHKSQVEKNFFSSVQNTRPSSSGLCSLLLAEAIGLGLAPHPQPVLSAESQILLRSGPMRNDTPLSAELFKEMLDSFSAPSTTLRLIFQNGGAQDISGKEVVVEEIPDSDTFTLSLNLQSKASEIPIRDRLIGFVVKQGYEPFLKPQSPSAANASHDSHKEALAQILERTAEGEQSDPFVLAELASRISLETEQEKLLAERARLLAEKEALSTPHAQEEAWQALQRLRELLRARD